MRLKIDRGRFALTTNLNDDQFHELLRLRGEVGVLRQQTNELRNLLARPQNAQPRESEPSPEPEPAETAPEEYPKTPDGATKGFFESWARGDEDAFVTNFGEPGAPREFYDRIFTGELKSNLAGLRIRSIGQPTNSFGPNMWFVPYTVRFKDGGEKTFRLHVAEHLAAKHWCFKGGF
jgi:hypothetical protein